MALAAAVASPTLAAETILPGYWESDNHLSLIFDQDSTSRKCITPDLVESYLTGPSTKHYTCVYDHRYVGGGQVRLAGQCVDRNGVQMKVAVSGAYAPESFHLKARFEAHLATLPIQGWATTDAHRLSADCPPQAAAAPPPPAAAAPASSAPSPQ